MTTAVITRRVLPTTRTMSFLLVIAAAGLTALAAQWRIPLPFTPVPITGQTFAVLITGAALGWKLGATGQTLYLAAGALGFPVFADATGGVDIIQGPTGGYLVGFVIAAGVVGALAEHRQDRTFPTMFTAFVAGSAIIYTAGVVGLIAATGWSITEAMEKGVMPFLLGDLLKATAAGLLLPTTWKLLDRA